jgi:hypothetical protein
MTSKLSADVLMNVLLTVIYMLEISFLCYVQRKQKEKAEGGWEGLYMMTLGLAIGRLGCSPELWLIWMT